MTDGPVCVDCYVRTSSLTDPVDDTLETVRELVEEGPIEEGTVHPWPSTVRLSDTTGHTDVLETYRTFEAWAERRDVSIEPAFSLETRTSKITDDRREVLVTPVRCLAVSVTGTLREVLPHRTDGRTYTVEDGLAALARRDAHANTEIMETTAPDDPCPWCGAAVVTGQGLRACRECEWVGIATGSGKHRQHRPRTRSTDARLENRRISSHQQ